MKVILKRKLNVGNLDKAIVRWQWTHWISRVPGAMGSHKKLEGLKLLQICSFIFFSILVSSAYKCNVTWFTQSFASSTESFC